MIAVHPIAPSRPQENRAFAVVCYETVANAIRELAAQSHFDLVETFADRIADLCLADPRVRTADVQVEKPLAIPDTKGAGVRVVRER